MSNIGGGANQSYSDIPMRKQSTANGHMLDRTSIGGGSTTAVLSNPGANDPELRTVIVFLISILRSLFSDSHVLH